MKKDVELIIDSVNPENSSIKVEGVEVPKVTSFVACGKVCESVNISFEVAPFASLIKFSDADVRYVHNLDYLDNEQLRNLMLDIQKELETRKLCSTESFKQDYECNFIHGQYPEWNSNIKYTGKEKVMYCGKVCYPSTRIGVEPTEIGH